MRARRVLTSPSQHLLSDLSVSSSLLSSDGLVLGIVAALEVKLGESRESVAGMMEMKHVLLLLIKKFHDLCEVMVYQKDSWLAKVRETVSPAGSSSGTVREATGQVIISAIEAAPWGLQKQPNQTRSDTAHTILATYKGMANFIKTLETELQKKADRGVDLKQYQVEEMQSDDDEDTALSIPTKNFTAAVPTLAIKPPAATIQATNPPPAATNDQSTGKKAKSGNYRHGMLTNWNNAEWLHMLRLYRDNPTESAKVIAQKHNAGYWATQGRTLERTPEGIRQQYKKLLGPGNKDETRARLAGKITEMEAVAQNAAQRAQQAQQSQQNEGQHGQNNQNDGQDDDEDEE